MRRPFIFSAALLITSAVAFGQPEKMEPVPDGSAIEQAEKLVKDIYKSEFAKKKAADQVELAQKLLKAGEETKDSASQYVMFREARELAAKGGDVYLALDAAAHTIKAFAVKSIELKVDTIETAEKAKSAPGRSVAEAALDVADDAILMDDFAAAERVLKLASAAASRGGASAVSANVAARVKELDTIQKAYKLLEPERKALAAKANDPTANAKVGRFTCFLKGNWEVGLPMLSMGNDETLQAIAKLDLDRSMAGERSTVADRWFEQAEKLDPAERQEAKMRAYTAYLQAYPDSTGLERSRIEKRLADLEKSEPKIIRLKGSWTVIFRSSDPSIWNTSVNRGRDQFALPHSKIGNDIRYLKLTEAAKNNYVIIEMSKPRLGDRTEQNGYGWNGKNNFDHKAYHLGIYDVDGKDTKKGNTGIYSPTNSYEPRKGWGFGRRIFENDEQGFGWGGDSVPKVVFEIAVKSSGLTAEESKRVLVSKKK